MFRLLCVTVVLVSVHVAPATADIVAVPVAFPASLRTQPTPPPPLPPTPTPTPATTPPPPPAFYGPLIVDDSPEEEPKFATAGDNSNGVPVGNEIDLPSPGPSSSCSFSLNVGNNYEPKNESFSYPR